MLPFMILKMFPKQMRQTHWSWADFRKGRLEIQQLLFDKKVWFLVITNHVFTSSEIQLFTTTHTLNHWKLLTKWKPSWINVGRKHAKGIKIAYSWNTLSKYKQGSLFILILDILNCLMNHLISILHRFLIRSFYLMDINEI